MQKRITDDLNALLNVLPPHISEPLRQREDKGDLLEVVLDLGRLPEARFPGHDVVLGDREATEEDLRYLASRIGEFGDDNRAGIPRTLHRISAIRNRKGAIVGLTCRVGRAVFGTIRIIEDLVQSGKNLLLLGRPGVGKTTMLREVARVLADDLARRVVIVDTSNEIAGDGDIPHPAIGKARRMQVPTPTLQHEVMIEAVENHMPQVIIIDEIGRELEAAAARTIAERGVQLVATAHGNTLDNLVVNPTLSDLVGGVQTVTLGDEEARRRGTQKTILERKAPPTFQVVVEIQSWEKVAVHDNVAETVDAMLRGRPIAPETRWLDEQDVLHKEREEPHFFPLSQRTAPSRESPRTFNSGNSGKVTHLYAFGVNRGQMEQVIQGGRFPVALVGDLRKANAVVTVKSYYRRRPQSLRAAEESGIPVFVLRKNSVPQMEQCLHTVCGTSPPQDPYRDPVQEVEKAVERVKGGEPKVALNPQSAYIRRLQHQIAERNHVLSRSSGREPHRRVEIFEADRFED